MALPTLLATCAGTALSAMGASAFNQALESHNDSLMKRTARRPIVVGKISRCTHTSHAQHHSRKSTSTGLQIQKEPSPFLYLFDRHPAACHMALGCQMLRCV